MPATLYTFKGIEHYGNITISDQLKANFIAFINWGLLEVGAFTNVTRPTTTIYGGERQDTLRPIKDPNFSDGRVWESQRKNWVYETGLNYSVQPIYISGVYVNNIFQPSSGIGTYSHIIDYPNGRIIFNNPISTSGSVTCNYSYKRVDVLDIDSKIFRYIQQSAFDSSSVNLPISSGEWSKQAQTRIQLPCIGIDVTADVDYIPKQLGGGQYKYQTIAFHVVAETSSERNKLCDIISQQKDRSNLLFDVNAIAYNNVLPLTSSGNLNANGINNYRNLLLPTESGGYQWKKCIFESSEVRDIRCPDPRLYYGLVYLKIKVDMPEI